jgi:3-mercaptopyruvate sulfurtransferase SseA
VRSLNITNSTHVVVYDASTSAPNIDGGAARVSGVDTMRQHQAVAQIWWTFRAMSHNRVSVLDGGIVAWLGAGHTLVDGVNVVDC